MVDRSATDGIRFAFWNDRRRRTYPRLLLALVVFWSVAGFGYPWPRAAAREDRYGGDFVVFWSAATIAASDSPEKVFDFETMLQQERTVVPDTETYPWHYPPQFLLVVRPFAVMPYWAGLVTWTVLGLAALGGALRFCRAHTVGVLALGLPAILTNVGFGQNGMFTGAVLAIGLQLVSTRPFVAGLALGSLTCKPHFAPVAVSAVLFMRNWRAMQGIIVSAVTLALVSYAVFGHEIWSAFFANSSVAANSLYEPGAWQKMPGAVAALLLAGTPRPAAQVGQALFSVAMVGSVLWLVRTKACKELRNAGIVIATLAASPYVFVYDMAALTVAYGWILIASETRPFRLSERLILAIAAVAPFITWAIADSTAVQLGPVIFILLLGLVLRRARDKGSPVPISLQVQYCATLDPAQSTPLG